MESKIKQQKDGFQRRTERKRQAILDTALTAVREGVFKTLSVDELATAAKVSKVSIYKYFGNRHGLENAMVEEILKKEGRQISRALESGPDFRTKMETYMAVKQEAVATGEIDFCISRLNGRAELSELKKEYAELSMDNVNRLLELGRQEGGISGDLSDAAVLSWTQMMIDYYGTHADFRLRMERDGAFYREVCAIYWRGIAGDEGPVAEGSR